LLVCIGEFRGDLLKEISSGKSCLARDEVIEMQEAFLKRGKKHRGMGRSRDILPHKTGKSAHKEEKKSVAGCGKSP